MNELDIFSAALELGDLAERANYLDQACADRPELRERIIALLRNSADASRFLESPAVSVTTLVEPFVELVGTRIGPYKLLQQIGEGGMGTVFLAEQHEPVQRKVALKVIKAGMDSRQVIARFDAERQALSLMDHPNIAKVLDAGMTENGRPYFVMELVKGQPITKYCDEHQLTTRQRLDLFVSACHAIQHAHQKGIIHRDVKPSNVLVAEYDDLPVCKVIDFGVAKALNQPLTEKSMFTGVGQIVGTLEYMSPEQAKVNQLDIDTRSDVYSLGVLLYELLTGTTPFPKQQLRSAGWDEMLRIIREEEPPKPSTRLSDLSSRSIPCAVAPDGTPRAPTTSSLASVAALRHTEPAKLTKLVRGELDWIVMKALEKNRGRRYETANGFAADIQRYLADEPVQACPPSAVYRMRKFARKHKAILATFSIVTVTLVLGLMGTSYGLMGMMNARRTAETNERRALKAEADAVNVAEDLQQVVDFQSEQLSEIDLPLMGLRFRADLIDCVRSAAETSKIGSDEIASRIQSLELLLSGTDLTGLARQSLEKNVFDRAIVAIDNQFQDQPVIHVRLLNAMAELLLNIGSLKRADNVIHKSLSMGRKTLGEDHPETLEAIGNMGYRNVSMTLRQHIFQISV